MIFRLGVLVAEVCFVGMLVLNLFHKATFEQVILMGVLVTVSYLRLWDSERKA